jgi:hypothetical protein
MGQIAVRYHHSDSVLMLCTLCGKNMPALAERLYFPELSIPGLSGCDVHGPTVAIYRMEIHPGMKCEDLGNQVIARVAVRPATGR